MKRRYLVEGEVQGVGFRHFTRRSALHLGLRGWVRNLADGRVEAVAEGDAAQIATFEAILRRGPPLSTVTNLQVEEIPDEVESPTIFEIR